MIVASADLPGAGKGTVAAPRLALEFVANPPGAAIAGYAGVPAVNER